MFRAPVKLSSEIEAPLSELGEGRRGLSVRWRPARRLSLFTTTFSASGTHAGVHLFGKAAVLRQGGLLSAPVGEAAKVVLARQRTARNKEVANERALSNHSIERMPSRLRRLVTAHVKR